MKPLRTKQWGGFTYEFPKKQEHFFFQLVFYLVFVYLPLPGSRKR